MQGIVIKVKSVATKYLTMQPIEAIMIDIWPDVKMGASSQYANKRWVVRSVYLATDILIAQAIWNCTIEWPNAKRWMHLGIMLTKDEFTSW